MNQNVNRLENIKRDEISHFSNYKWLSNWEYFLTSNYWKSWKTKISTCQTEKELSFYAKRLKIIADLISSCEKYGDGGGDLLIKQEEKRLETISEEDFKKEDKFADVELREVSVEEALNDPWFSKQIDNLFGSKNKKLPKEEEKPVKNDSDGNVDYKDWTKEQLISEINRLKTEIESLKNNQTLTISERQARLQQNQQKLERLKDFVKVDNSNTQNSEQNNSNNNFPTGLIIGGVALGTIGLVSFLVIKNIKKNKK